MKLYGQFVKEGDLVFDVGANIGLRTKVFLNLGANVVAVEPQKECTRILRILKLLRPGRLEIVPKALGAVQGTTHLHVCNASRLSSMSPDWIRSVKESGRFSSYSWGRARTILVTTLDKLIEQYEVPSFIKIDVEGYELEVLKGLTRLVPALSFEFTPEFIESAIRCIRYLQSLGEIEMNYSLGEKARLEIKEWLAPDQMIHVLKSHENDSKLFGDVYVRFIAD